MTAEKIIEVAREYIGTTEKYNNNVLFNTAYYGHTVNGSAYPWCAVFVWYVFREAGAADLYYGGSKSAYCPALVTYYKQQKQWYTTPKVGDLVFYNFSKGTEAKHVGIVTGVSDTYITAIEGNTSSYNQANGGMVMERSRSLSVCLGFARPRYDGSTTQTATATKTETASRPTFAVGKTYTTVVDHLRVRRGPGTGYAQIMYSDLSANARKHAYTGDSTLKKGTRVTCNAVKTVAAEIWMKIPSGWICAYQNKPFVG